MNYEFEEDQSEEFYRKLLLLDKLNSNPVLTLIEKQYIFHKGYCWDILFKDESVYCYCLSYAQEILKGPFPEGEPYIAKAALTAKMYAQMVLKDRFPMGEELILSSVYKYAYLEFLEEIGKEFDIIIRHKQ